MEKGSGGQSAVDILTRIDAAWLHDGMVHRRFAARAVTVIVEQGMLGPQAIGLLVESYHLIARIVERFQQRNLLIFVEIDLVALLKSFDPVLREFRGKIFFR